MKTQDHIVSINGRDFVFRDFAGSSTVPIVISELGQGTYRLREIPLEPGDVVIDIGANVGIISIILAAFRPQITVHAFEPVPETYESLCHNVEAAGLGDRIKTYNRAVAGSNEPLEITFDPNNSGSSSAFMAGPGAPGARRVRVEALTLDEIFHANGIERCKLLKLDAEGAEYDILSSTGMLNRVDHLVGEFHGSPELSAHGKTIEKLYEMVSRVLPADRLCISGVFAQPTPEGTKFLFEPDLGLMTASRWEGLARPA